MSKININKKVDIIIPNYNKGKYLEEAIVSVINQIYKNWNLYIIDDNSNDSSKKILKKYAKNKKINIFLLKKNKGPGYCRNYGISKSKSKLIAFLDSDDFWTKDKLSLQIKYMIKTNSPFTYTDYISFYQKESSNKILGETNITKKLDFKSFIKNSSINTSTMIVTRKLIENIKFRNLEKLEDYIFKCEILKKHKNFFALKSPKATAYYRLLKTARSKSKITNIYFLWILNKKFNKLNFIENILSIISVSINSIKKYGLKLGV